MPYRRASQHLSPLGIQGVDSMANELPRRSSLPIFGSFSDGSSFSDLAEDRKLPPLPRVDPLPRGPFSPFTSSGLTNPPSPLSPFPGSSTCFPPRQTATPPSPPCNINSSCQSSLWQNPVTSPAGLSQSEILSLAVPTAITRKPPLQQLCGQKRKSSMCSDHDDQREKHRVAEGNRRKNLSQLHRELDSRLHDYFLIQAGWNPARNLPQSKEHIIQAAIYLIDFMRTILLQFVGQEGEAEAEGGLTDRLRLQASALNLQQIIPGLDSQSRMDGRQPQAACRESHTTEMQSRTQEIKPKSCDNVFRTPKSEVGSPRSLSVSTVNRPTENTLPGVRALCDDIDAVSPKSARRNSWIGSSLTLGRSLSNMYPPTAGPHPTLSLLPQPFSPPVSWRVS